MNVGTVQKRKCSAKNVLRKVITIVGTLSLEKVLFGSTASLIKRKSE